ncbi:MAG TPA: hypothetical protein VF832_11430, partial [Longimicrobiales bacterium]
ALAGESRTEGYLTEPALMAHGSALGGALHAVGTLDLEGLTLQRGELTPGAWGEGYVDRRHPHTYVHELILSARGMGALGRASLSLGKGFAPYGTDDPMVRPFVKYPTNHHLAQVPERALAIAAVGRGPLLLEAGLFNGDEPKSPGSFADVGRFGDSWSARATVRPLPGLELQGSHAFLRSPENPDGHGLDQRKWSASVRWGGNGETRPYALLEWATTNETGAGAPGFRFSTLLAEGSLSRGPLLVAGRVERSTRPEEERLADPFRVPRVPADFSLLGVTRWESAALHARWRGLHASGLRLQPFAEAMLSHPSDAAPSPLFQAARFYGSSRIWTFSAGVRLEAGTTHMRMGRYGVADD